MPLLEANPASTCTGLDDVLLFTGEQMFTVRFAVAVQVPLPPVLPPVLPPLDDPLATVTETLALKLPALSHPFTVIL